MGDIGEFWRDVRDANRAAGLPARRSHHPRAEAPTRKDMAEFKRLGFERKAQWHWQLRIGDRPLDYWPSKCKWQWDGAVTVGPWDEMVALIERERAAIEEAGRAG